MRTRRLLRQPGPELEPRVVALPCSVQKLVLRFPAGKSVLSGISDVLAVNGIETAMLEFAGGRLSPLVYVIPAVSTEPAHVAWYSDQRRPEGVARFERAVMSFGWDKGEPFLHCHGIWLHADGFRGGGHLITDQSVFAEEVEATVWAICGARLERLPDEETNFSLLTPIASGQADPGGIRGVLLRIRPNFDIHGGIETAARANGIGRGRVHGVISLVDCDFEGGQFMESYASEGFIHAGHLEGGIAQLSVGVAAMNGEVFEGGLVRGGNVICIASEILVIQA